VLISDQRPLPFRLLPRLFRLAVLASVAALVYAGGRQPRPADEVSLDQARTFFPDAARLATGDQRLGGQTVVDAQGGALGLVLTTSPHTDEIIGYSGPNNLLIALDTQQRVIGVQLLTSGDTQAHVDQVQQSASFWKQFASWKREEKPLHVEGISGSTLTSLAMAETVERRLGGSVTALRFPDGVTLAEVKSLFPAAVSMKNDDPRGGWQRVLGPQSRLLGFAVRTSPYTDNGRGYRGPTESLIAIAPDAKTVAGVLIRRSYDTPEYVARVKDDDEFLKLLTGRTIEDWATMDFARAGIEGVSGATQTSFAVADGLKRRLAADVAASEHDWRSPNFNPALVAVIIGALVLAFTPLRTSRRLRLLWQVVLVVVFLVWLGDLVSLSLLAGWARHDLPWQTGASVILLVAVAFLVPWTTRRQIYCQSICPHGAAQSLLGRFKRLHIRLPRPAVQWLSRTRFVLLAVGVAIALFWTQFDLAWLEPFDGWVLKSAALVSASIAVIGLVASVFVPQAYCRFGCPTGELLALVKSGGHYDRITRRDLLAAALVAVAALVLASQRIMTTDVSRESQTAASPAPQFGGHAFGTTWSVKLRGNHDPSALHTLVTAEIERVETTLSHWRADSLTSQFNASETTLAVEYPAELITLVARAAELSRLTNGRYDITVAPLVDAWGFGPSSGEKTTGPTDEQIEELLSRSGWQKLIIDRQAGTLRKTHPRIQLDLGSLLQGYAADRAVKILDDAGVEEFVVEVGGELFARGAWQVAIEDPRNSTQALRTFTLRDSGLATSGFYRATKQLGGSTVHHLISPHTGHPIAATAVLAAVVAPTATEADAWATALLVSGLPDAIPIANAQGLAALLLDSNYQPHSSSSASALRIHQSPPTEK
jgi:thiamine biosynthesis lipoprotein ApbE/Na+-translocating ferredoxin:NAD+ oxidoreductase RnfG subunit